MSGQQALPRQVSRMAFIVVKPVDSSPELIDNMTVEANKENKRDSEDDDGHCTKVKLPPDCWPVCKVTDTLWLGVS